MSYDDVTVDFAVADDRAVLFGGWRWVLEKPSARVPIGLLCFHCEELFTSTDDGLYIPHFGVQNDVPWVAMFPEHKECFLVKLVGSIAHQTHACPCYGGDMGDPPVGMSARRAAVEALRMATLRGMAGASGACKAKA